MKLLKAFLAWLARPMPDLTPEQRAMLVRIEHHSRHPDL